VRRDELGKLKKIIHLIGSRTRDLRAYRFEFRIFTVLHLKIWSRGNGPDSHSGGARFESRKDHQLSRRRVFMAFAPPPLNSSRNVSGSYLDEVTTASISSYDPSPQNLWHSIRLFPGNYEISTFGPKSCICYHDFGPECR
jgi:hypothetical protein